jgi:hypothetical protein
MFGLRKRKRDRNVLLGLLEMLAFGPRNQLLFLSVHGKMKRGGEKERLTARSSPVRRD